jgi:hypothetical protein
MSRIPVDVPKKPTTPEEMWPSKASEKSDGYYIQYRDVKVGPFPDLNEVGWYDMQIQEIARGQKDKSLFAGQIIQFGDVYYVERWDQYDGPFMDDGVAKGYRQHLYDVYETFPKDYVGVIYKHVDDTFWFTRQNNEIGPFETRAEAETHRDKILAQYRTRFKK